MKNIKNHLKSNACVLSASALAILLWGPLISLTAAAQTLLPFDASTLTAIKQTHAGKPFVLSFWALHCEPCRDEMAEWRALKEKHPALPIVLVSTDSPRDAAVIAAFFNKYPPGAVEKRVFTDAMSERVRYSVDKSWRGELPKTYFFDAAHKAEAKSGKVDRDWVEARTK